MAHNYQPANNGWSQGMKLVNQSELAVNAELILVSTGSASLLGTTRSTCGATWISAHSLGDQPAVQLLRRQLDARRERRR
jgi:hypothetical protein